MNHILTEGEACKGKKWGIWLFLQRESAVVMIGGSVENCLYTVYHNGIVHSCLGEISFDEYAKNCLKWGGAAASLLRDVLIFRMNDIIRPLLHIW